MRKILLASVALLATASAPPPPEARAAGPAHTLPAPGSLSAAPLSLPGRAPRYPGFAGILSNRDPIASPRAWTIVPSASSWAKIARSTPATRQLARWDYARSLIGSGLGEEALGVLDVMLSDDPDLGLAPSYLLARGASLTMLGRANEALSALAHPQLAINPEACAWRLRALAAAHRAQEAVAQVGCSLPAINARTGDGRTPFLLAAGESALDAGRAEQSLRWLSNLGEADAAANLIRGRAYFALGQPADAKRHFAMARRNGNPEQRVDAELSAIEEAARHGGVPAKAALKRLDKLAYAWRGDEIEERALKLSYALASKTHDLRGSLAAGSTLFRYFPLGQADPSMLAGLQASLLAALAPDSALPIDQAAGLFWDYRDLTPAGAAGDYLVARLGDRLQSAGLYGRAAELLEHQLLARTTDIAQGPLSARVATLHILSGKPDRALAILRKTDAVPYPADMLADRLRVEAVALTQLGKTREALAILQTVPNGAGLTSEILWRSKDWAGLAATGDNALPRGAGMNEVAQTVALRQAIALAMLGREKPLAALRARYRKAFAGLKSAALFDLLTRPAGSIDPSQLGQAMAGLPSASPAGDLADLLDAQSAKTSS